DIGLAPLQDSEFYRAKYFNKYLEYSSKQIVGVYSNVEPYSFVVEHSVNGFLVNNSSKEWVDVLCYLIENADIRQKISQESYHDIQKNFSLDAIMERIISKIPEIISYKAPTVAVNQVKDPSYIKSFYF